MKIIHYEPGLFNQLVDFLKSQHTSDPAVSNMWVPDWQNQSNTLLYLLHFTDRFSDSKGKFLLLYDGDMLVGCSGIYISDFSDRVAIAGVRTWLDKNYRNKQYVKDYFLPEQRKWSLKMNIEIVLLTFNHYNKNIIKLFTKGQNIGSRSENHLFYKNFNVLDFPVTIQYTPQWIIYEIISGDDYNWELLRAKL